jgi:hypothetical protein
MQSFPRLIGKKREKSQVFLICTDGSKWVARMRKTMKEVVVQGLIEPTKMPKECEIRCI